MRRPDDLYDAHRDEGLATRFFTKNGAAPSAARFSQVCVTPSLDNANEDRSFTEVLQLGR